MSDIYVPKRLILPKRISTMDPRYSTLGQLFKTTNPADNSSCNFASNNDAIYVPMWLPQLAVATHVWWINGGTLTGNADVGVYDATTLALLFSCGSTARSGASAIQEVDITDAQVPGGRALLFGLACASSSGTFAGTGTGVASQARRGGLLYEASALPLPATATPVASAQNEVPEFGITIA